MEKVKHKYRGQSGIIYCHSRKKCEKVAELDKKVSGLNLEKSIPSDFSVEETVVEMRGICTSCMALG